MSWKRCGTAGRDEDDRARPDGAVLVADRDPAAAGDHVVDLVLGVRLLEVRLAGRQHVQPDRQVRDRDELEVGSPGRGLPGDEIGELEGIHGGEDSQRSARRRPRPGGRGTSTARRS